MFELREPRTLKLAREIEAKQKENKAQRECRQFTALIEGKPVTMSSRSWAEFKNRTEQKKCGNYLVENRVHGKWQKWDVQHAVDAPTNTKYVDYLRQISGKMPEPKDMSIADKFIYGRIQNYEYQMSKVWERTCEGRYGIGGTFAL